VNRRWFLGAASAASVAGALGLPLAGCVGFHYVDGRLTGTRLRVRADALGDRGFALVDVPAFALPLYLHRQPDGAVTAVSTRCMHQGCQVEPTADRLVCPCHGSEYASGGAVLKGPTQLPLRTYPVIRVGEDLEIDLAGGEP